MLFTGCARFSPACSGAENDYIIFSTWYVIWSTNGDTVTPQQDFLEQPLYSVHVLDTHVHISGTMHRSQDSEY